MPTTIQRYSSPPYPNQIMSYPKNRTHLDRHGFTLIELLVVVSILIIVGAMIIPTVRTLNEDRKIRDTARVVGSVFAAARERAALDGWAGVEIVSIANANGIYNLPNMGLVLYQLRSIPPYTGDTVGASCAYNPGLNQIEGFLNANVFLADTQIGDLIELNGSGVKLLISGIAGDATPTDPSDDFLVVANPLPNPPIPAGALSFKIYRQPVRIESSAVRLPNNLFLNMALSGYGPAPTDVAAANNQWLGRQFRDFDDPNTMPPTQGSTKIWFAADGSVSFVQTRGFVTSPTTNYFSGMQKPSGPIHLLMCNGNGDAVDLTNLDSPAFLQDDNNMWITIDHRNGGVTMGKMAQFNPILSASNTLRTQIQDSRTLARNRRSATP